MDRVANSGSQRVQYQPEPRQAEASEAPARNSQARSYSRLSPDQQRAESVARKPKPAVKTLGSRIDVYA